MARGGQRYAAHVNGERPSGRPSGEETATKAGGKLLAAILALALGALAPTCCGLLGQD